MMVEPSIFRCHQRIDEIGTQVGILHSDTVLIAIVSPKRLHIGGEYLTGELILRVLQFLYGRQIANLAIGYQYDS